MHVHEDSSARSGRREWPRRWRGSPATVARMGRNLQRLRIVMTGVLVLVTLAQPRVASALTDAGDAFALQALYDGLGGASWTTKAGWAAPIVGPCDDGWHGVTCNDDDPRRVIALELGNNNLVGELGEVGLPKLQRLDLSQNSGLFGTLDSLSGLAELSVLYVGSSGFEGNPFDGIKDLTNLEHLDLSNNMFSGTIPTSLSFKVEQMRLVSNRFSGSLDGLSGQSELTRLQVEYNQFSGTLDALAGMVSLDYVSLHGNQLSGDLSPVAALPALRELLGPNNDFSGSLDTLENVTSLTSVNFSGNRLSGDLCALAALPSLVVVQLHANELSGNLDCFAGNTVLRQLDVHRNMLSGSLSFLPLARMRYLHLGYNDFYGVLRGADLATMPLIELKIPDNNRVTVWDGHYQLPSGVKQFEIDGTSIASVPEGAFDLPTNLGNLKVPSELMQSPCPSGLVGKTVGTAGIHVCERNQAHGLAALYSEMGGTGWSLSTGWSANAEEVQPCNGVHGVVCGSDEDGLQDRVIGLDLRSNYLDGTLPSHAIASLSSLVSLEVPYNSLEGELDGFNVLTKLQLLDMYTGDLSGNPFDDLAGLSELVDVNLAKNHFTGSLPSLADMAQLERLDVSDNSFEGSIANLSHAPKLLEATLSDCSFSSLSGEYRPGSPMQLLKVTSNALSGTLDGLGALTSLQRLDLKWNQLEGSLDEIAKLHNLQYLTLSNNLLTGNLSALGALTTLIDVRVDFNDLSGSMEGIQSNLGLTTLLVARNRLSSGLCAAAACPALRDAYVSSNAFSGTLDCFSGHTVLQVLSAANNKLTGSLSLLPLPSLYVLSVERNALSGVLSGEALATMVNLRNLMLTGNVGITAWDGHYPLPPQLSALTLDGTSIASVPEGAFSGCCESAHILVNNDLMPDPCPLGLSDVYVGSGAVHACQRNQVGGLAALFHLTGGASWYSSAGWDSNPDNLSPCTPGSMFGVTCDDVDGQLRVTELELPGNNLAGAFPAVALSSVSSLRVLNFANNNLAGSVAGIEVLSSLTSLHLGAQSLSGDLSVFSRMTSMVTLDVGHNEFTGSLVALQRLTKLELLSLHHNELTGTLDGLEGLELLGTLLMGENYLSGPLDPVSGMSRLHTLLARANMLSGSLEPLRPLSMLLDLDLSYNQFNGTLAPLAHEPDLRYLYLANNMLSGDLEPMRSLVQLERLDVGNNRLSGPLHPLLPLIKLWELRAAHNALSGEFEPALVQGWASLERLELNGNALTGMVPPGLQTLPLTFIDISDNELSGYVTAAFASWCDPGWCTYDSTQHAIADHELDALRDLADAAAATTWAAPANTTADPCIEPWPGVICDWSGRVRYLRLPDISAGGEEVLLPDSLLGLAMLVEMDVPGSRWRTSIVNGSAGEPRPTSTPLLADTVTTGGLPGQRLIESAVLAVRWYPYYEREADLLRSMAEESVVGYANNLSFGLQTGNVIFAVNVASEVTAESDTVFDVVVTPVPVAGATISPAFPDVVVLRERVDLKSPTVSFAQTPPSVINSETARFALGADEPRCRFEYALTAVPNEPDAVLNWIALGTEQQTPDGGGGGGGGGVFSGATMLANGPGRLSRADGVVFEMNAAPGVAHWEYSLDQAAWSTVEPAGSNTLVLDGLSDGPHEVLIRAVEAGTSAVDAFPVGVGWVVDADYVDLAVSIDAAPAPFTPIAVAEFAFSATHVGSAFEYRVDDMSAWQPCLPQMSVGPVGAGDHRLEVRARSADAASTSDVAEHVWTYQPAESGFSVAVPFDGAFALLARGRDESGNVGAAAFQFERDTVPPDSDVAFSLPNAFEGLTDFGPLPISDMGSPALPHAPSRSLVTDVLVSDGGAACTSCELRCFTEQAGVSEGPGCDIPGLHLQDTATTNAVELNADEPLSAAIAVTFFATDVAGNDEDGSPIEVFVDEDAPQTRMYVVDSVARADSAFLVPLRTVMLQLECDDASALGCAFRVNAAPGATPVIGYSERVQGDVYSATAVVEFDSDGDFTLFAAAVDAVGNLDDSAATVVVSVDTLPPGAPDVHWHSLDDSAGVPLVASDAVSLEVGVQTPDANTLFYCVDSASLDAATHPPPAPTLDGIASCAEAQNGGVFNRSVTDGEATQLTFGGLTTGAYRVAVWVGDVAGNAEPGNRAVATVLVDVSPPNVTLAGTDYIEPSRVTALHAVASEPHCVIEVVIDGGETLEFDASDGTAVVSAAVETDGRHTAVVWAIDAAHNRAAASVEFVWWVDTEPPHVVLIDDTVPAAFVNDATASWSYRCADAAPGAAAPGAVCDIVAVVEDDAVDGESATAGLVIDVEEVGVDFVLTAQAAVPGVQLVTLWPVDGAGNTGPPTTVSWTYDVSPPSVMVDWQFLASSSHADSVEWCLLCDALGAAVDDTQAANAVGVWSPERPTVQLEGGDAATVVPLSFVRYAVDCSDAQSGAECTSRMRLSQLSVADNNTCVAGAGGASQAQIDFNALPFANRWATVERSAEPSTIAGVPDGTYRLRVSATDAAGNELVDDVAFVVDTTAPTAPSFVLTPELQEQHDRGGVLATSSSRWPTTAVSVEDASPQGSLPVLVYTVNGETGHASGFDRSTDAPTFVSGSFAPDLTFEDGEHALEAWFVDFAGNVGARTVLIWEVSSGTPPTMLTRTPALTVGEASVVFELESTGYNTHFEVRVGDDPSWVRVCTPTEPVGHTLPWIDGARASWNRTHVGTDESPGVKCALVVTLVDVGSVTFRGRAVSALDIPDPDAVTYVWEYADCEPSQYAIIDPVDSGLDCSDCPPGADCAASFVTREQVVATAGYWSGGDFDFYSCPIEEACVNREVNGTFVACANGYMGLLCDVCDNGFFRQFGRCVRCPATGGNHLLAIVGIVAAACFVAGVLFALRRSLPMSPLSVSLSFAQILAASNSSYTIQWPAAFNALLEYFKVFMLDILTVLKADCAGRLTFLERMQFTLLLFVSGLAAALLLFTADRLRLEQKRRRRARGSALPLLAALRGLNWSRPLKPVTFLAIVSYPSVSATAMKLFPCRDIGGERYLAADMTVPCSGATYYSHVMLAVVVLVVYTIGFPLLLAVFVYRRRHVLDDPEVIIDWGFLFHTYGSHTYWWRSTELLRKFLLTVVVVLFDTQSAFNITFAVIVSAFAHVLHSLYKPFPDRASYLLQHLSLGVTTLVFTMGLLVKVEGLETESVPFTVLATATVMLPIVFLVASLFIIGRHMLRVAHARFGKRNLSVLRSGRTPGRQDAQLRLEDDEGGFAGVELALAGPGQPVQRGSSTPAVPAAGTFRVTQNPLRSQAPRGGRA